MDMVKTGKFIQTMRKEKQLTQAQLAEKIHVTPQAVSKWERGLGIPDMENMESLSEIFHVSLAEMVKGERDTATEYTREQVDEVLTDSLKMSRLEKQLHIRRIRNSSIGILIGIILVLAGIHLCIYPIVLQFPSSSGSSAVFVAGKVSTPYGIGMIIAGALLILWFGRKLLQKK